MTKIKVCRFELFAGIHQGDVYHQNKVRRDSEGDNRTNPGGIRRNGVLERFPKRFHITDTRFLEKLLILLSDDVLVIVNTDDAYYLNIISLNNFITYKINKNILNKNI